MPTYDFRCDNCSAEFEKFLAFDDVNQNPHRAKTKCPKCQSARTHRIIKNPTPVVYKGEGFTKKSKEKE